MGTINDGKVLRIAVGTTNPCKIKAVEIAIRRLVENNLKTTRSSNGFDSEVVIENVVELDIQGYNVESNVSEQPYSDMETKCGAMNRARNAYYYQYRNDTASALEQLDDSRISSQLLPDLAIGIEGGLEICNSNEDKNARTETKISKQLYCMAWIAIYGRRTEHTNAILTTMAMDDTTPLVIATDTNEIYGFSKTAMFLLPPALSTLILDQGMELGHADDLLFRRTNSKQASGTVGLLTNSIIDRTTYYDQAILLAMIPWMHPNLFPNGHAL